MAKQPRIRKSTSSDTEAVLADETVVKNKGSKLFRKLASPLKSFVIFKVIFNFLSVIFRPVKKILSFLVPKYFINSWKEVRRVSWPNRKETWRLTLAVMIFAIVFGSLVAGVDKGLDELFKKVILK